MKRCTIWSKLCCISVDRYYDMINNERESFLPTVSADEVSFVGVSTKQTSGEQDLQVRETL